MVKLDLKYALPFYTISLCYNVKSMDIHNVLLDTDLGGSLFKMDFLKK